MRLLLSLSLLLLSTHALAAEKINAIVAIVNGEAITELDVKREEKHSPPREGSPRTPLDELIDRRLQLQRAERFNIQVTDSELERRLIEIKRELGIENDNQLEIFAQKNYGLDKDRFINRVKEDLRIQRLFYQEIYSVTQVYEDDIRQFLMSETAVGHRLQYRLAHILIEYDEDDEEQRYKLAVSLHALASGGENFSDMAKVHSDGNQALSGGDLGYKSAAALPALFLEEAQNMEIGDISPLIETSRGYHILKLLARRGGDLKEQVERVRLSHIFLPLEDPEKVREIHLQVKNGKPFAEAVAEHSIDEVSIPKEGDFGWFLWEDIPPYFTEAVAKMSIGDISEPIESPFGYHILLMTEKKSSDIDMKTIRERAERILRERRALAQRDIWLRRLRSDAYVRVLDPDYAR